MTNFDPSGTGSYHSGLFGIPTVLEKSRIVIIPVPWEVTTSYGGGTARGPQAVLEASPQIDLFDLDLGRTYEKGYHLLPLPKELLDLNDRLRPQALKVREALEQTGELSKTQTAMQAEINVACAKMCAWVHGEAKAALKRGQIPAVLGGDHSSPEGNIQAVSEHYKGDIGVLHFDAHADLRHQYQGFERSHASIMNNVMNASWKPKKLVQVGIRDFSEDEHAMIQECADINAFFDSQLKSRAFKGETWDATCKEILSELPQKVYVSFDIDGLDPRYCPRHGHSGSGGDWNSIRPCTCFVVSPKADARLSVLTLMRCRRAKATSGTVTSGPACSTNCVAGPHSAAGKKTKRPRNRGRIDQR